VAARPSEDEVLSYFAALSNWGRWGPDDQLGTLNLITDAKRVEASRAIRSGHTVSLAHPLDAEHPDVFGRASVFQRYMVRTGEGNPPAGAGTAPPDGKLRFQAAREYIGVIAHGSHTHVDALSHAMWDGRMYNGFPATAVTAPGGATVLSVHEMTTGVTTRGVLLDIAGLRGVDYLRVGDGVTPDDLEEAERKQRVRAGEGDAVIIYTGNLERVRAEGLDASRGQSGYHAAALPWFHSRGVAVVSSDSDNDVKPSGYASPDLYVPVHAVGMCAMGLCLVDNMALGDLVATCRSLGRWDFFFAMLNLRIVGATASLVNPVAIF
jgi:kynurenine formamidase